MTLKILTVLMSLVLPLHTTMAMHGSMEVLFHIVDHHNEDGDHHHHGTHETHDDHDHDDVFDNPAFQFEDPTEKNDDQQESNDHHSHALPSTSSTSFTLIPSGSPLDDLIVMTGKLKVFEVKSTSIPSPYLSSIFRPPRV